ncbi:uncharacterized protein MONBRDRAFT_11289 [Monosiga brevicollis MX1]|uniref:U2A'/phosphoprotein 32 family A C-terminal domain-containing protein n=1 Tax=Monosiga brevicollis TaxID=81824 RepID=A9V8S6_MONBE|nr:uncharacterized protein MONBRDRAFT_11289 [Monosiga brevicollis MX1]EDQ86012.1 predicted protein [Monosiga brevicollis MX1]|eukprot:XP_001749206.1 hypothetical protein [Monosiga brevicollis MX1]
MSSREAALVHITKNLLLRRAGLEDEDDLHELHDLDLAGTHFPRGRIKYMEGFERSPYLKHLTLSSNWIKQLSNLHTLQRLETLRLDNNDLSSLKGIGQLSCLRVLNVEHNKLTSLPPELFQLTHLRELRLAQNRLASLHGLHGLASLANLCILSIFGNPVSDLPHTRAYLLAICPYVDVLDGISINNQERRDSQERLVHLRGLATTPPATSPPAEQTSDGADQSTATVATDAGELSAEPDDMDDVARDRHLSSDSGVPRRSNSPPTRPRRTFLKTHSIDSGISYPAVVQEIEELRRSNCERDDLLKQKDDEISRLTALLYEAQERANVVPSLDSSTGQNSVMYSQAVAQHTADHLDANEERDLRAELHRLRREQGHSDPEHGGLGPVPEPVHQSARSSRSMTRQNSRNSESASAGEARSSSDAQTQQVRQLENQLYELHARRQARLGDAAHNDVFFTLDVSELTDLPPRADQTSQEREEADAWRTAALNNQQRVQELEHRLTEAQMELASVESELSHQNGRGASAPPPPTRRHTAPHSLNVRSHSLEAMPSPVATELQVTRARLLAVLDAINAHAGSRIVREHMAPAELALTLQNMVLEEQQARDELHMLKMRLEALVVGFGVASDEQEGTAVSGVALHGLEPIEVVSRLLAKTVSTAKEFNHLEEELRAMNDQTKNRLAHLSSWLHDEGLSQVARPVEILVEAKPCYPRQRLTWQQHAGHTLASICEKLVDSYRDLRRRRSSINQEAALQEQLRIEVEAASKKRSQAIAALQKYEQNLARLEAIMSQHEASVQRLFRLRSCIASQTDDLQRLLQLIQTGDDAVNEEGANKEATTVASRAIELRAMEERLGKLLAQACTELLQVAAFADDVEG